MGRMRGTMRADGMGRMMHGRRGMASLAWKLLHGAFDFEVSMKHALPGIPAPELASLPEGAPSPAAVVSAPGGLKISALSNGIKIVSCDVPGPHASSLGLLVHRGSRFETPANAGASLLLEYFAYKGSTERSKVLMQREIESLGAHFVASAHRDIMIYGAEGMRKNAPDMVRILAEAATKPVFGNWYKGQGYVDPLLFELKAAALAVQNQWKMIEKDAVGLVSENLNSAAYEGNTLGLPLFPTFEAVARISPKDIADFAASTSVGSRMVLAGVNVDHSVLEQLGNLYLGDLPASDTAISSPAKYTGGERRVPMKDTSACAIGFEGVKYEDQDLVPACVLQTLLGGGGAFSSGGPGKGMYTKLYTGVLTRNDWVINTSAINNIYVDSGLFGICASSEPGTLPQLVELVAKECLNMASKLDRVSLERAKNMTITGLRMNLESPSILCEDVGRQILVAGEYKNANELVAMIKKVTSDDLERIVARMLSSKPSVSIVGDLWAVPSYFDIQNYIESKA